MKVSHNTVIFSVLQQQGLHKSWTNTRI